MPLSWQQGARKRQAVDSASSRFGLDARGAATGRQQLQFLTAQSVAKGVGLDQRYHGARLHRFNESPPLIAVLRLEVQDQEGRAGSSGSSRLPVASRYSRTSSIPRSSHSRTV